MDYLMKADEEIRLKCLEMAIQIGGKPEQTTVIVDHFYSFIKTGNWPTPKKHKRISTEK